MRAALAAIAATIALLGGLTAVAGIAYVILTPSDGRFWARDEEGMLWGLAVAGFIVAGSFLGIAYGIGVSK